MQFDHRFCNRKAQSHAAVPTREMRLDLEESLEDARQVTGWDTDPIIVDSYFQIPGILSNSNVYAPARISILERVLHQVAEGNVDFHRVGIDVIGGIARLCIKRNVS